MAVVSGVPNLGSSVINLNALREQSRRELTECLDSVCYIIEIPIIYFILF